MSKKEKIKALKKEVKQLKSKLKKLKAVSGDRKKDKLAKALSRGKSAAPVPPLAPVGRADKKPDKPVELPKLSARTAG
jgi:hypothetical protein